MIEIFHLKEIQDFILMKQILVNHRVHPMERLETITKVNIHTT